MDATTCVKKLGYVGILSFATVDEYGHPQVRSISAVHYEPDAIYFYTARGKNFCRQLLRDGHVQIHALTKYKEMIRLSAVAQPVPNDEQEYWKDVIFREQPYLVNVYPDDTRSIGIIFVIRNAQIEYFNLGVRPIDRAYFTMGDAEPEHKGFEITEECIACGTCQSVCPQGCIEEGDRYHIQPEHCLHCGNCYENCPSEAIVRID
ncbi:4Fe-4S binding protein [Bacteroides zoogleoformans]|uniref:4Fe-4S binding protein n=1 Tax=Bacteroides zoogleoformans TaxID=28119 RepID=UPI003CD0D368